MLLAEIILGAPTADDADGRQVTVGNESEHAGATPSRETSALSASSAACWAAEDDFWTFCHLLRKLDADRKSGEFLEALGAVLRIVAPCRCRQCCRLSGDVLSVCDENPSAAG